LETTEIETQTKILAVEEKIVQTEGYARGSK
jgi:hypothetical protein